MFLLKEINLEMGQAEYEMFQDIPANVNGSKNLCNGIPFENFSYFLEMQLARQFQKINQYDTPTKVFIFYHDKLPVGYICIRTEIDEDWKNWSGNIYYAIRKSERNKGLGTKMLGYALKECKKLGINPVFIKASAGNVGSQKVIENNKGLLLRVGQHGGRWYKIDL